jgi:D-cysteine desulfhydrase
MAKRRSRKRPPVAAAPVSRRAFVGAGLGAAALLAAGSSGHYAFRRFNEVAPFDADALAALRGGRSTLLLERYPGLAEVVPWLPLGRHDTPVEALPPLEGTGDVKLFIKRDDLTSALYGGNKVRKLEHLLAEARLLERRRLITLGGAGTHHGLATALYGGALGFGVDVALFAQPYTPEVERSIRGMVAAGARLHYDRTELGAINRVRTVYRTAAAAGDAPRLVPLGGSSRLGSLGYVNAALELAAQVEAGLLPEPDRIFVALGSGGSAAGLVAGCRLAGLRTRVHAVRVTSPLLAHRFYVHYLANDLLRWLADVADAGPARARFSDFEVVGDQLGPGYGHPTEAGEAAAAWLGDVAQLEPTYTAKALAACVAYCRRRARPGETVLYWHTANGGGVATADEIGHLPDGLLRLLAG